MSSLQYINPRADLLRKTSALNMNINAAKGLQEVLKSNIGPKGTLKMLVGGGGQIKITKDGNVLLHEMQIQHPTASMIARTATAQDDQVGDGTTSNVLFIGELMKQSERHISEGIHPSIIVDGIELAKKKALQILENVRHKPEKIDREFLLQVARTSLRTKLVPDLANQLTEIIVDAVLTVRREGKEIDLHMIEVMHMLHKMATETRLVKGLVMDHGARHPDMPKKLTNCFILICNVSLEYEKTEVNSGIFYKSAEERERLVMAERKFTDDQCRKIIELKRKVCDGTNKNFVVINMKGIDPLSLDMLAKDNIIALRRAKRRNMERLILACGGNQVNSVDDITPQDLGFADEVYEQSLGDDKYTFVEGVKDPFSCTILIKGQNEHSIAQIKDAIRDGTRAVKNVFDDQSVIPGAGAFEIYTRDKLLEYSKTEDIGKCIVGIEAFAESLLIVPKCLCDNSGQDSKEAIINVEKANRGTQYLNGIDITNGKAINPILHGIFDNYCVKKTFLNIGPVLVQQLLLVDEIMRAGKQMKGQQD